MSRLSDCLNNKGGNYILPFFWQHGEDDETLIREIQAIYDSGVYALCVESRTHEDFCKDGWWHTMRLILDECKKRDMKVWILDDKHFPSGFANSIIPEKYPERRMWAVTERHIDVTGPQKDAAIICDWKTSDEDTLLGIVACKRVFGSEVLTGETIDLTACEKDGMVYFDLPEGCWRIVYLLKTRSGYNRMFINYADKLTKEGGDAYIEAVYEPHFRELGDEFGKTLMGFFSDEPGFGNNSATGFRADSGVKYSHFPYAEEVITLMNEELDGKAMTMLPGLWFDSENRMASRVRLSYMNTITKLYSKYFTYRLGDWCRAHNVEYIGHVIEDDQQHTGTQNSAGHYFRALDGQDMGGIDVVLCQVVPGMTDYINTMPCTYDIAEPNMFHFTLPKLGSSHGHIQPLKKGRSMCEIYGAYGWAEGLKMMKWLTDLMLVRGINRFVPHAFTPKFPDLDCPPHFFAQGNNPQYKKFRMLMEYMNRVCHIHDGGEHIQSVALLYHAQMRWANGDGEGAHMRVDELARYMTEHQLDYDIVSEDYLDDAVVKNGVMRLANEKYPCLLVPAAKSIPESILNSMKKLAAKGLPVYIAGNAPIVSETGEEAPLGDVKLIAVENIEAELKNMGFADITADKPQRFLRAFHYTHGNEHTYMLTNEDIHSTVDAQLRFSAFGGGKFVWYDALENKAYADRSEDGSIRVSLLPYQSVFVIFGDEEELPERKTLTVKEEKELSLTWDIAIAEEKELPVFTPYKSGVEQLFNINGRDELPSFAGHIRYTAAAELTKKDGRRLLLDLGDAGESVTLNVNGVHVGDRIVPPYRFDITDAAVNGTNEIEVIVTTHLGYKMRDKFSRYLLMEPTGLLGSVKAICVK